MASAMKVIWCDGYARETVADRLIVDGLTQFEAETYCKYLRDHAPDESNWYRVEPDNYRLWGGMSEFV